MSALSAKKYIVLAPPCDLMVRSKGRREPELQRVPLAEIVPETPKMNASSRVMEDLPYFDGSRTKKWFVKLKAIHYVRACILDLCVFNQDGISKLVVNGNVPSAVRPAWRARHAILLKLWGRSVRRADMLAPASNESQAVTQAKAKIAQDLGGLLFDDDLFKGNLGTDNGERVLTFNCRRVGRLSRARAIGLLLSYTGTLGRPAFDRDFGVHPRSAP